MKHSKEDILVSWLVSIKLLLMFVINTKTLRLLPAVRSPDSTFTWPLSRSMSDKRSLAAQWGCVLTHMLMLMQAKSATFWKVCSSLFNLATKVLKEKRQGIGINKLPPLKTTNVCTKSNLDFQHLDCLDLISQLRTNVALLLCTVTGVYYQLNGILKLWIIELVSDK